MQSNWTLISFETTAPVISSNITSLRIFINFIRSYIRQNRSQSLCLQKA